MIGSILSTKEGREERTVSVGFRLILKATERTFAHTFFFSPSFPVAVGNSSSFHFIMKRIEGVYCNGENREFCSATDTKEHVCRHCEGSNNEAIFGTLLYTPCGSSPLALYNINNG